MHRLTPVSRKLRREATPAEGRLWSVLKNRQISDFRFRRQVVLSEFVVDFACLEARLVIEVDGATHSTEAELGPDERRDLRLRSMGYEILRFRNQEVYENLEGVAETIRLKQAELRPRIEADGHAYDT
jgi:very-short-patch-repair endonuclease